MERNGVSIESKNTSDTKNRGTRGKKSKKKMKVKENRTSKKGLVTSIQILKSANPTINDAQAILISRKVGT